MARPTIRTLLLYISHQAELAMKDRKVEDNALALRTTLNEAHVKKTQEVLEEMVC